KGDPVRAGSKLVLNLSGRRPPISGLPEIGIWARKSATADLRWLAQEGEHLRVTVHAQRLRQQTKVEAHSVENKPMSTLTLDQANRIIAAILARGAEIKCRPLSVIVVEPGCKVKAFQKEEGSSMIRFEMAYGKAYAALAMGRSSKLVRVRAEEKPIFMRYLISA